MDAAYWPITPVPAPRQVRSNAWAPTPPVLRYRAFRDEVRWSRVSVPERAHLVFLLPLPPSWPARRRAESLGMPHLAKPDTDNLIKSLLDAVFEQDSGVWDIRGTKLWWPTGGILVLPLWPALPLRLPFDLAHVLSAYNARSMPPLGARSRAKS